MPRSRRARASHSRSAGRTARSAASPGAAAPDGSAGESAGSAGGIVPPASRPLAALHSGDPPGARQPFPFAASVMAQSWHMRPAERGTGAGSVLGRPTAWADSCADQGRRCGPSIGSADFARTSWPRHPCRPVLADYNRHSMTDPAAPPARVLVVDDDTALAEMIGIVLRTEGIEPSFCADGSHALGVFRDARPDLVLLDLMLPGIDGIACLRADPRRIRHARSSC